jgi:hypothetical protein
VRFTWTHCYAVQLQKLGPSGEIGVWNEHPYKDPLQPRIRVLSPMERAWLEQAVHHWLEQGVVEPAPRAWITHNPVFVEKKSGAIRTCIDFRPTNETITAWDWPLPRIRDIRFRLVGTSWYFRLDLKDAFHRIDVAPTARALTAFHTHLGTFQFRKMPFGLNTAPSTYQRFLDWVLHTVKQFVINYVDDILGYATSLPQLRRRRRRVMALLRSWGIAVNYDKSIMETQEVDFVGLRIRGGAIGSALDVRPFPTPRSTKEWQSALGFANCFRDFIPNYADQVAGLYPGANQVDEAERDARWQRVWTGLHDAMTLQPYDDSAPAALFLDASQYAVGAVLTQKGKVCAIFSKGLTSTQSRYSTTDREHLALLLGAEAFRVFIQSGQPITLNTDHTSLLNRQEDRMTPRQLRWKWRIMTITANFVYVAGRDNPADYWSRAGWKGGGDKFCLYKEDFSSTR